MAGFLISDELISSISVRGMPNPCLYVFCTAEAEVSLLYDNEWTDNEKRLIFIIHTHWPSKYIKPSHYRAGCRRDT